MRQIFSSSLAVLVLAGACSSACASGSARSAVNTLAIAANGSDRNSCLASSPCATFNRAYHMAAPGQTVLVQSGAYPPQTILPDPSKAGALSRVVFAPAPGAPVSVAGMLDVRGSHVEVANLTVNTWHVTGSATSPTSDVVMRNVTVSQFFITGASDVQVLGG